MTNMFNNNGLLNEQNTSSELPITHYFTLIKFRGILTAAIFILPITLIFHIQMSFPTITNVLIKWISLIKH